MARILIVGGSLGGLLAANVLLRAGHEVQVLERSPRSLQGRGAGIVTHECLRGALRCAGVVADDAQLGVAVDSRVVLGSAGQVLCRGAYAQILTSWGRLYSLLRAALPEAREGREGREGHLRLGAAVHAVTQDEAGVAAHLAGGETLHADLLVAADGIRSTVRGQVLPAVQPQYAGYVAWRGVCDEAALSRHTRETLFPFFGFGLPAGEQMLGYPVAGSDHSTAAGRRRWNFVWYRPAAAGAELAALMTDADGVHHAEGISPQQVSWRHIAALREAARQRLAPQFAEVVEKTALPFIQPIHDLVSPALAHGRIVLLGDAAFVARPHVGMGVAKAGDDALALAACFAAQGATPQAARAYDAQRRPAGLALVERGRRLGAYLEAQRHEAQRHEAQRHDRGAAAERCAEEVMQQTAIDPTLFDTAPAGA